MPSDMSPFGYEQLPSGEKTARVGDIFGRVASRYDVMNDLMSGGLHRYWKNWFVSVLPLAPGAACVEVATGSADIALRVLRRQPSVSLTAVDPNPAMLDQGRRKLINAGHVGVKFVQAGAESLPLPAASQDLYTIAFGLRNVTHLQAALAEAYRVLKSGGWWYCLEFSHPTQRSLQSLYKAYSQHIIPKMGRWVANDAAAYRYLVDSIATFCTQEALAQHLRDVEFSNVGYANLTGGIVACHYGQKIEGVHP